MTRQVAARCLRVIVVWNGRGFMRRVILVAALILVGCSKTQEPDSTADVSESAAPGTGAAGSNVSATPIAGVAMTFAYSFRLAAPAVAATQEKHAGQCEALGPARCRITGAQFHRGAHGSVMATLTMKLAPPLARAFGKQGVDIVVANGGMLTDSEIESRDAGLEVSGANRGLASSKAEQRTIAAQLARTDLPEAERTQLQYRLQQLRDADRAATDNREQAALLLASTPVTFRYYSGAVDAGLNDGPILGAIKDGWSNIIQGVSVITLILVTLLPWLLAGLLIVFVINRSKRPLRKLMGLRDESETT